MKKTDVHPELDQFVTWDCWQNRAMVTTGDTGTVRALLVGIDNYRAPGVRPLRGCRNDIAAARSWLETRVAAERLDIRELTDAGATVPAVAEGIAEHLGGAGPGDTALLWFSGHGTEFRSTDPAHRLVEATGWCQALVCADGPLADKELRPLLDAVAARGVHVVAVLDCCFSGGLDREDDSPLPARYAPAPRDWGLPATAADGGAGVRGRACAPARDAGGVASGPVGPACLLLAASRLDQRAYEDRFDGVHRGLFSHALLGVLAGADPGAGSRELLAGAHSRVRSATDRQHPVLSPVEAGGIADRPLLGGVALRPPSPHLLRFVAPDWEVDCGTVHGLRAGDATGLRTEFTVTGPAGPTPGPARQPAARAAAARTLRVRAVHPERALVTAQGWEPDPARVYRVALSALALPPAAVLLEAGVAPEPARRLRAALDSAGPGGRPSPMLALDGDGPIGWRVSVHGGAARVLHRDGSRAVPDPLPLAGPGDARRIVDCLLHLTRWEQLRRLDNPASPLAAQVALEITSWDGTAARPQDESGGLVFAYGGSGVGGASLRAPLVSVRIRNRSRSRRLWCLLLDLTDSHASRSLLYPGHFIGPGGTGHALDGRPVQLSLPASRPLRPGASAVDWLKLIVAEGELNTVPFEFGPWVPAAPAARDDAWAADGVLRLTAPARSATAWSREAGEAGPEAPGQWAALTVRLTTLVPGAPDRA